MLRNPISLFLIAIVLIAGAAVAWWLASPLWIDNEVNEEIVQVVGDETVREGGFVGKGGIYQGAGNAKIIQRADGALELAFTDFNVTNGPALKVWLSTHEFPQADEDVTSGQWVNLGDLKGNIGNQSYIIPEDVDLSLYQSVVIWCQPFGVLFASAPLDMPVAN